MNITRHQHGRIMLPVLVITAVVLLIAAIAFLVRANSEVVTEERFWGVGYKSQSGSQFRRYKLAQALLDELNYNAQRGTATVSQLLTQLQPKDTLILLERSSNMPPPQARKLLQWVERGGHLIVEAFEFRGDENEGWFSNNDNSDEQQETLPEPLLEPFGIAAVIAKDLNSAKAITFTLPNSVGREFSAAFGWDGYVLRSEQRPDWKVDAQLASSSGSHLLSYKRGRGRLTAISDGTLFVDERLHEQDHAALLDALLTQNSAAAEGRTWMLWQLPQEQLIGWLKRHILPTLATLVAALLLWLAWAAFRFGPIRELQSSDRRALTEHLLASGQLFWSPGRRVKAAHSRTALVKAARWGVLRDIQRHHTSWPQLARSEQISWLSHRSGLHADTLNSALFADEALDERGFTLLLRQLQTIRHSLLHPNSTDQSIEL